MIADITKERAYRQEIDPLIRAIHEICQARGIPFAAHFELGADDQHVQYVTSAWIPPTASEHLVVSTARVTGRI